MRFTVKNEYGLGVEELYKDGVQSEDPKLVLDGVAVAGLVGVLRQLGDLAQLLLPHPEVISWLIVFNGLKLHSLQSRGPYSHKQTTYALPILLALNGILASKRNEIISSVMTCHILSWIHMMSAENLHVCSYLIDSTPVVLDLA